MRMATLEWLTQGKRETKKEGAERAKEPKENKKKECKLLNES